MLTGKITEPMICLNSWHTSVSNINSVDVVFSIKAKRNECHKMLEGIILTDTIQTSQKFVQSRLQ